MASREMLPDSRGSARRLCRCHDAAREDIKTLEVMAGIRRNERDVALSLASVYGKKAERMERERDAAISDRDDAKGAVEVYCDDSNRDRSRAVALAGELADAKRHAEHIELALREHGRPKQAIGEMATALVARLSAALQSLVKENNNGNI